jgi:hypothetical protein
MRKRHFSKSDESEVLEVEGEVSVTVVEEAAGKPAEEEAKPGVVSRAVYKAFYGVSYGVVFSSLLVGKLIIPKNSLVESAIHDGAVAARKAVEAEQAAAAEVVEESAVAFEEGAPVAA